MVDFEKIKCLEQKAHELTTSPGVYLMYDKNDKIIYIGKAKNLKNRVSSYFRSIEKHNPKVYGMVTHVEYFKTIISENEFEALVLECSQIKEHNPKYNILLKDDKGYCYLKVSNEEFPRLSLTYRKDDLNAKYIGPYISSFVVKQTIDEANKLFGLPICKSFPKRPCLNYHIKQCIGPCKGNVSKEEYQNILDTALNFINDGSSSAIKILNKKMLEASDRMNFEEAARYRDRIKAINAFNEKQHVFYPEFDNCDFISCISIDNNVGIAVLKFRNNFLKEKQDFFFPDAISVETAREEFMASYYSNEKIEKPKMLYIDKMPENFKLLEQYIGIKMMCPQRGEHKKIVEMARHNAAERISISNRSRTGKDIEILDELKKILALQNTPTRIESFDISNFGQDTIVGAMILFENGKPQKSGYRKFIIKGQVKQDDYSAMREMLTRRLNEYKQNNDGFNALPNLWLIDGGTKHVNVAKSVVKNFNLNIPVYGMVKDNNHKTRAIATDGQEVIIYSNKSVFNLITKIQDETHRFAITFARKRHTQKTIGHF